MGKNIKDQARNSRLLKLAVFGMVNMLAGLTVSLALNNDIDERILKPSEKEELIANNLLDLSNAYGRAGATVIIGCGYNFLDRFENGHYLGFVSGGSEVINLRESICKNYNAESDFYKAAEASGVIAHEWAHSALDIENEGCAEKVAIAVAPDLMVSLGVDRMLPEMRDISSILYDFTMGRPPEYNPDNCQKSLDELLAI